MTEKYGVGTADTAPENSAATNFLIAQDDSTDTARATEKNFLDMLKQQMDKEKQVEAQLGLHEHAKPIV